MNHRQIIKTSRESLGISHDEAAAFIGISTPHHWDLENHDDEMFATLNLGEVVRLCQMLQLSPRILLPCASDMPLRQPEELKQLIVFYCRDQNVLINEVEERAGWEVKAFLDDPQGQIQGWNLDCLRDVCSTIGVNHTEFIPNS